MKPKIICLCGSSRFVDIMAVIAWEFERDEGAIVLGLHLLPQWYTLPGGKEIPDHHMAEAEGCATHMDALHLKKIDLADEVFVVNKDGYIGDSTRNEISYAHKNHKPVRFLEPIKIKTEEENNAT